MKYPQKAIINGKTYSINTDYQSALECFHIIDDEAISDTERALGVIYKLFGYIPEKPDDIKEMLRISGLYLGCGEEQENHMQNNRDFDFEQDWKFIVASFMTDYQIDLEQSEMHWYQFINLIQGLTEATILSRVRELRNYDTSSIKDFKTKNIILEAQKKVSLQNKKTYEEEQIIKEFESLFE